MEHGKGGLCEKMTRREKLGICWAFKSKREREGWTFRTSQPAGGGGAQKTKTEKGSNE